GAGGAADNRVIHDDDTLTLDYLAHRVELELDTFAPLLLRRLDERAPHIAVLDQPDLVGDARLLGEPNRRRHARIWHARHDIGLDGTSAGQRAPQLLARQVDVDAVEVGVRPCEVDVLERAQRFARRRGEALRTQAAIVNHHHLAWLDIAHERRANG